MEYEYEREPVLYTPPQKVRRKTFDWFITRPDGSLLIVETKGWWDPIARIAETMCIEQHPELDIRYVFMAPGNPIRKGSKTSYADWCRKHNILYAARVLPQAWLEER